MLKNSGNRSGMPEEEIKKRLFELADRSYAQGQYTFTSFLGLSEVSVFHSIEKELRFASPLVFGGYDEAERSIVRFGDPGQLGYEESFPIDVLEIAPLAEKFSDELTHRDFLGALMSLGIERSLLGDIVLDGNKAYLFCLKHISEYITDNIVSVKHTSVSIRKVDINETNLKKKEMTEKLLQTPSLRCDAVISKVYNLSRSDSAEYFRQGKVFINGCVTESTSHILKESDSVTVRGLGRFVFSKSQGLSRKGKINISILY